MASSDTEVKDLTLSTSADVEVTVEAATGDALGPNGTGLSVSFSNLKYTVASNVDKKTDVTLLKGLSGVFLPNQLTAIMGASGCGKTTLLDVLAGRKTSGTIEGTIQFGGKPLTPEVKKLLGYVEQFDTLIGSFTVEEMLSYTAELKRPRSEPLAQKKERVEATLGELGLDGVRATPIGDALVRGISGGQAKRVNIGIALITDPALLFLDEPTTGLDSAIVEDLMEVVQALARRGRTVVCTIHSPSHYVFRMFDKLYLMSAGQAAFFGDPATQAVPHFEALGHPFEAGASIGDYLIHVTGGGLKAAHKEEAAKDWGAMYAGTALAVSNQKLIDQSLNTAQAATAGAQSGSLLGEVMHETWVLIKYRFLKSLANPEYLGERCGDKVFLCLILCTLYWSEGSHMEDPTHLANVASVLWLLVVLPSYGAAGYMPSLILERPLYTRERNDNCYHPISYLVSKLVTESAVAVVVSFFWTLLVYYALDLSGSFLTLFIIVWVILSCGIALAYAIASVAPSMSAGNALLPTYVTMNLFFSGGVITFDSMPVGWKWFSYIDFMRYGYSALMLNQFEGNDAIYADGKTILEFYDMDRYTLDKWQNVGALTVFFAVFTACSLLGLTYVSHVVR